MSANDVWQPAFALLTSYRKHFQEGFATIVVGPAKKDFTIHKELLVFYSDYFRAALNGSFVEASDRKIELLDVEEDLFQNFHAWIYTRKLVSDHDEPLDMLELINLWVFGDRFQVPMLQNCAIDEMFVKRNSDWFGLCVFKEAYKKTVVGSPLRKALIDLLAYRFYLGDNEDTRAMTIFCHRFYTVEILADLVRELDAARKNNVPYSGSPKRDKCFFHVHGKDEHC